MRIPKETIEVLKDQVFGFDTFFVTSQEPYEVCTHRKFLSVFIAFYLENFLLKDVYEYNEARIQL